MGELLCPICSKLYRNPVLLPCCKFTACRCCALQKLLANGRKCWLNTETKCEDKLTVSQLKSNEDLKNLVTDFQQGGILYKDKTKGVKKKEERPSERIVREYIQEASSSELKLEEKYKLCKEVGLVADGGSLEVVEK